jgi:exodeoxyribonuclease-1
MNFYFYDYETFGVNPKNARIAQFAGIRTDSDLNILSEKKLYCQPSFDSLPDPISCNITGITPSLCLEKGLIEREFIGAINNELSQPNTCTVGYNNIRFDDEITRFTLYRNFFDPYAWAWKGGNSRWDLLDVIRMCYALKKDDSLNWVYDDGVPSFKLDRLAPANGIHINAHDALEDVRATIALAKIIKDKQPKLFTYALSLRDKKVVKEKIQLFKPMLHTSGMFAAKLGCTRRCVALGTTDIGNFVVFNLDQDPSILLELTVDELKTLQFSKQENLPEGQERLQVKELHPNKSPMFVPSVFKLEPKVSKHLQIDMDLTNKHLDFIVQHKAEIANKIKMLYTKSEYPKSNDVEQSLYDGFLSNKDKQIADKISTTNKNDLVVLEPNFEDAKLNKLLTYFKARNYPEILTSTEEEIWFELVQSRIYKGDGGFLSIDEFEKSLSKLKQEYPEKSEIWQDLLNYAEKII